MLTFKFIFKSLFLRYYQPRYWWLLLAILVAKILVFLPASVLSKLGQGIGLVSFYCVRRRREIARQNLRACFPHLSEGECRRLLRAHFISMGLCIIETISAWMMPSKRLNNLICVEMKGQAYLDELDQHPQATGIIIATAHFMPLEIMGRYFGERGVFDLVYQQNRNPLFEVVMRQGRSYAKACIERREIRQMVSSLQKGHALWYCPDQDFGAKVSVFVPFFGIQCATSRGITWLSRMTGASILFARFKRVKLFHYDVTIEPFSNSLDGHEEEDARIYNAWLEKAISESPADYLWVHRRFKTRPPGESEFYEPGASS